MKIRYISDIHAEFGKFDLPVQNTDKDTVLILAGDIGLAEQPQTYVPLLEQANDKFRHVIYIPGNHEYYHADFTTARDIIHENLSDLPNVNFMDMGVLTIDDVTFIGATMWTSFNNYDVNVMSTCQWGMNDYSICAYGERRLTPEDIYHHYKQSIDYITLSLHKHKNDKTVVVTHQAPHFDSVHEKFRTKNNDMNYAYYEDLEQLLIDCGPDFWIHGHVHNSLNYIKGRTNVLCNPRGYVKYELNNDFNPIASFEI